MYQNVRIGNFFNLQLIMHYQTLTLASLSCLFTLKIGVFALFTCLNPSHAKGVGSSHPLVFFVNNVC